MKRAQNSQIFISNFTDNNLFYNAFVNKPILVSCYSVGFLQIFSILTKCPIFAP